MALYFTYSWEISAHFYCGQTAGWIKMARGVEVGHSPVHIVLDGDPAPFPKREQAAIFGPFVLWPNAWMHQDATWYGGRPQPRRLCVRWGSEPPLRKGAELPIFGPRLSWPNGCTDQDATWYGGRHRLPTRHCFRRGHSSTSPKGAQPPNCRPIVRCGQNGWMD